MMQIKYIGQILLTFTIIFSIVPSICAQDDELLPYGLSASAVEQNLRAGFKDFMITGNVTPFLDTLGIESELANIPDNVDPASPDAAGAVVKLLKLELLGQLLQSKPKYTGGPQILTPSKFVAGKVFVKKVWQWVEFDYTIKDPIVITGPILSVRAIDVKIKNITEFGFKVRLYQGDCINKMWFTTVDYVAMTRGKYIAGDGLLKIEADSQVVKTETDIPFTVPFKTTPAVVATRQDGNDNGASSTRIVSIEPQGFNVGLQDSDSDSFRNDEGILGYIAIQQGSTNIPLGGGLNFRIKSKKTKNIFDKNSSYVDFGSENYNIPPTFVSSISYSSPEPAVGVKRIQTQGEPTPSQGIRMNVSEYSCKSSGTPSKHFVTYFTFGVVESIFK